MRSAALAAFGLFAMLTLTGCLDKWGFVNKSPETMVTSQGTPTAQDLVIYLNKNSQRLQSLRCDDVEVECKQGFQSISGLTANMACEQPRNFRMSAKMLGKGEFDLGSNDREFWYWIGKSNPPYQFYCAYDDLRTKKIPLPFPFQPEWVLETFGMATYPTDGQYRVVEVKRDKTIELIQDSVSLQGQPVRKVVVFNREAKRPQIRAYLLRDMQGNLICSAEIQEDQQVSGAMVPYKLKLSWTKEKSSMFLTINHPSINQVSPEMAQNLFRRVPMRGIQSFDLASQARSGDERTGVQPAGGFIR